ncbi:methyltransferase domain-containing protein [Leptobacterium flavescens]|uniref:Methyltransferase domain-containing protein n=1 Tax=Leptobacterium flavescens TaxID=472055 RepID=A0A6P0UPI6_9FLAO|nr:methyltransferase domain-containing protein [Leptobacterium flavescens]NER14380.1 methyltransferase domain-containing protein [Leptobacterium flavescens]
MSKLFTLSAVKNLKQTGSLFRSSRFLAEKLTQSLDPDKEMVIVELGAGDGIITKQILNKMGIASRLYSYEINETFLPMLNDINDDRLNVLNKCVSGISTDFKEDEVDMVISSLPLTLIDFPFKKQLMSDVRQVLKPEGQFVQYQYSKNDMNFLKNSFAEFTTNFCLLNLPPAFIYTCIN